MTLTDLVPSLPSPRDLIQSAALALRPGGSPSAGVRVALFGLGLALGAGLALLCAPSSGRELRRKISTRLDGNGHDPDEDLEESSDTLRHASTDATA